MSILLCLLLLVSSAAADAPSCVHQSKANFFSNDNAISSGACGYGPLALDFYDGHLAAGAPTLYKNGSACGTCFQIKCLAPKLCNSNGTTIVLSDQSNDLKTDFTISKKAFKAMANKGMDIKILNLGIVDVEYKKVPCQYRNKNLSLRVEESSKHAHYFAVKLLYQGGQTTVSMMEVAAAGDLKWSILSRNFGAVWATNNVPIGALQFRFGVQLGLDGALFYAKNLLPAKWKQGVIYDTGIQIDAIAIDCI